MARRIEDSKPGFSGVPGITRTAEGFQAAVWKKGAEKVSLLLYQRGSGEVAQRIDYPPESFFGEFASLIFPGLKIFPWEYCFVLDGKVTPDPYAKVIYGRETFGEGGREVRCGYLAPGAYRPERKLRPLSDTVIYKLHVRGFTKQRTSGVKKKGTFQGIREKIPYLLSLGITAVELMPAYDFLEKEEKRQGKYDLPGLENRRVNYWGYTGGYYFVPKAAYCATKNPQGEFLELVEAFHEAGLECYMDFFFPGEADMLLIRQVLYHWKREYGVDGFCVMGENVSYASLARDPMFTRTRLLLPPMDERVFDGMKPAVKNILVTDMGFQCCARRFLKGDEDMVQPFLEMNRRNPDDFGVVNYVANHDGFTLADTVCYDYRHNESNGEENRDGSSQNYSWNCGEEGPSRKKSVLELRGRLMRNAILMLFLSQGTPMIYAGDEQGNSQQGNNNAYCQDNPVGWVDWSRKGRDQDFIQFVKDTAAFRKAHPVFHMGAQPRNMDYKSLGAPDLSYHGSRAWYVESDPSSRGLGMLYNGAYVPGEPEEFLYVVYNMYWQKAQYALPRLPRGLVWRVKADTSGADVFWPEGEEPEAPGQKMIRVDARSIKILCARPARAHKGTEEESKKDPGEDAAADAQKGVSPGRGNEGQDIFPLEKMKSSKDKKESKG